MSVISIVPRLPPAIDGVGDYAFRLARQLRKDFGIETHFIVGDPNWSGATTIEEFPIEQVNPRSANVVSSLLSNNYEASTTTVLLHYVGHGYARRGCPLWLVKGLEHWKNNADNACVVTMFHELYAFDPPWRSNFWLSLVQKNLAIRVARLSNRCLTSRQRYANTLSKWYRGQQTSIPTLPVFSNIGELGKVIPLAKRARRLVVFGQNKSKLRVYQESFAELSQACQALEIEEIWDIGPSTGLGLATVNNVPVIEIGERPASEVSEILSNSMAGFLHYDTTCLAKSGIFAAYCSHGLLPVSYRGMAMPVDGLEARKHYWIPDHQGVALNSLEELQAIADNAYTWYQTHNLSVQAQTFANYIAEGRSSISENRNNVY